MKKPASEESNRAKSKDKKRLFDFTVKQRENFNQVERIENWKRIQKPIGKWNQSEAKNDNR